MAFDRLQALGDEKFGKILNLLMRGEPGSFCAGDKPPGGTGGLSCGYYVERRRY